MGKFFTGMFIGAVVTLFAVAKLQLDEEEEAARVSEAAAQDAVNKAANKPA